MRRFWCRIAVIMVPLIAPPLGAQHVLTLDNGDRLSGRLVRLEDAHWVFRTLGTTVRVPAEAVAGFAATDAIGLRLRDGTIVAATVAAGPADSLVVTGRPGRATWVINRLRSDATVTARVAGGVGVRVGVLNEYNSDPRPGIEHHDMLVTTTLTYQIGQ